MKNLAPFRSTPCSLQGPRELLFLTKMILPDPSRVLLGRLEFAERAHFAYICLPGRNESDDDQILRACAHASGSALVRPLPGQ